MNGNFFSIILSEISGVTRYPELGGIRGFTQVFGGTVRSLLYVLSIPQFIYGGAPGGHVPSAPPCSYATVRGDAFLYH